MWSRKWTLGNNAMYGSKEKYVEPWDKIEIEENLYDSIFRDFEINDPGEEAMNDFLAKSFKGMLEAHLLTLVRTYSDAITLDDVLILWEQEVVREIMES